jgi:HPt (histidine-containing phosphotransfer) domain-containing protein
MSYHFAVPLVDESELAETRATLGPALPRLLGYFREDGPRSIARIKAALDADDAAAIVAPADTLKSEARQFGCQRLGGMAEAIEMAARRCVEARDPPTQLAAQIAMLPQCFAETLALLEARLPPISDAAPALPTGLSPTETARPGAPDATPGARPRLFGRRMIHRADRPKPVAL